MLIVIRWPHLHIHHFFRPSWNNSVSVTRDALRRRVDNGGRCLSADHWPRKRHVQHTNIVYQLWLCVLCKRERTCGVHLFDCVYLNAFIYIYIELPYTYIDCRDKCFVHTTPPQWRLAITQPPPTTAAAPVNNYTIYLTRLLPRSHNGEHHNISQRAALTARPKQKTNRPTDTYRSPGAEQ